MQSFYVSVWCRIWKLSIDANLKQSAERSYRARLLRRQTDGIWEANRKSVERDKASNGVNAERCRGENRKLRTYGHPCSVVSLWSRPGYLLRRKDQIQGRTSKKRREAGIGCWGNARDTDRTCRVWDPREAQGHDCMTARWHRCTWCGDYFHPKRCVSW